MNRNWTPESRVTITDAGVVIEVELGNVQPGDLVIIPDEAGRLCLRGWREDVGKFETRLEIPPGHSLANARVIFVKGRLRIEVPKDDERLRSKPRTMLIYCNGCGKHFDIVIAGKGPKEYRCPACGKVQVFDLEEFVKKAIEQGQKMLEKKRRGR